MTISKEMLGAGLGQIPAPGKGGEGEAQPHAVGVQQTPLDRPRLGLPRPPGSSVRAAEPPVTSQGWKSRCLLSPQGRLLPGAETQALPLTVKDGQHRTVEVLAEGVNHGILLKGAELTQHVWTNINLTNL